MFFPQPPGMDSRRPGKSHSKSGALGALAALCHHLRAVILAITLFLLYLASAWVMLRTASNPRLSPLAWAIVFAAVFAHSDAIVHMMSGHPVSIGLLEALSLLGWTLGVLACLICVDKQSRVLGSILLASAAVGAAFTGYGRVYAEENAPSVALTAHILLSMAASAVLFAAAVTAVLLVFLDRRLRNRRLADLPSTLPPLDCGEPLPCPKSTMPSVRPLVTTGV